AVVDTHPGPGLKEGLHAPRGAAGDIGRAAAVGLGQQLDDDAGVAMGARRQNEGVLLEIHQSSAAPASRITATTSRATSLGTAKLSTYCSIFQPSSVRRSTPEPRVS